MEDEIKEADFNIEKLEKKSHNLQKYIEDQQILNEEMAKQNALIEKQINQMKVFASKLEMLEKLNQANEKQMDKNQD